MVGIRELDVNDFHVASTSHQILKSHRLRTVRFILTSPVNKYVEIMAGAGGRAQEQPLPAVHTLLVRDFSLLAGMIIPGTSRQ